MTTDPQRPEVDDPRVLALAAARQQRAHRNPFNAGFCPPWDGLTEQEQHLSLLDARNYLRAAIDAGLVASVPSAPADRAVTPLTEVWAVWRDDEPPYGYFATEDAAKQATIDCWQETESVCPDYSWRRDGPRWELVVGGEYGGVYASRHKVYGAAAGAPVDRERIAAALYRHEWPRKQVWEQALAMDRETFLAQADAVLAVPPAPVDRAAVHRLAADAVRATIAPADWPSDAVSIWNTALNIAEHRLRRMADEAAAVASCPGYETIPSPCRCPCYGCKHHCAAHGPSRMADEEQQPETQAEEIALLRLTVDAVEEGRRELRAENALLRAQLWTLASMLDGLHTLIATSSRDWQTYRVDAWLWAVLCGWDCEQTEHTDTCTHGALEETAAMHGWDDDTVAKARRYRAAVRAITEPAAVPEPEIVHGCPPDGSGLTPCCGRTPFELPLTDRISSEAPVTCPGSSAAVAQPGKEAQPIPCNAVHLRVHHAGHQWEPQPGMDRIPCAGYPAAAPQPEEA